MNKGDQTTTDNVKLTLHNALDAKLIAILAAMPKGHKARLIGDALLAVYDVDATGALQMRQQAAPASSVAAPAPASQDEPTEPAPAPQPKAKGKPAKLEVETF